MIFMTGKLTDTYSDIVSGDQTFSSNNIFTASYTTDYYISMNCPSHKAGDGGDGKGTSYLNGSAGSGGGGGGGRSSGPFVVKTSTPIHLTKGQIVRITANEELIAFGSYISVATGTKAKNGSDGQSGVGNYAPNPSGGAGGAGEGSHVISTSLQYVVSGNSSGTSGTAGSDGGRYNGSRPSGGSGGNYGGGKGGNGANWDNDPTEGSTGAARLLPSLKVSWYAPDDIIKEDLEYITTDGSQYIDTGINPVEDWLSLEMTVEPFSSETAAFFGSRESAGGISFCLWLMNESSIRSDWSDSTLTDSINTQQLLAIQISNGYQTWVVGESGDIGLTHLGSDFALNNNLFLLGCNQNDGPDGRNLVANFYGCKIYGWGGELIRDYIPVLDITGAACLYDNVQKQFIYPATGNSFTAGPLKL